MLLFFGQPWNHQDKHLNKVFKVRMYLESTLFGKQNFQSEFLPRTEFESKIRNLKGQYSGHMTEPQILADDACIDQNGRFSGITTKTTTHH